MVDNRLLIEAEDEEEGGGSGGFSSKPRVSMERNRQSLKFSFSFIADGLSPKSKSLYMKLPSHPLNLSVLKLDGSSFDKIHTLRALIRTAKSPSNSTLLKRSSRASSTPRRAAKASTSKTIKGIGINRDSRIGKP